MSNDAVVPISLAQSGGVALIPIWFGKRRDRRQGIIDYAVVDPSDYPMLSQFRWIKTSEGYAITVASGLGRKIHILMHRLLMGLGTREDDPRDVDHVNRIKLDNRRSNLRVVPPGANAQNVGSCFGSTSQYRGVCFYPEKGRRKLWRAAMKVNGKRVFVGHFATELEAARAASNARKLHMPYAIEDEEAV